jgi:alginate O-acetyltransferase complex protein AlgI
LVFSSLIFLCVFLPLNLILYYSIKNKTYRNWLLIIMSMIFYAWGEPVWISLLLFTTFFDYFNGLIAGRNPHNWKGKAAVITSIAGNLLVLGFFKYSGFFVDNINAIFGSNIHFVSFSLPIGISFYTFQTISYVLDVYKGEVEAQKSPFKLLLFVSLFHQLVAGPIVRYKDIADNINHRVENWKDFNTGVRRFIIGLGKKVIIANTAGDISRAFLDTDYSQLPVLGAWFGILLFALQIYFDFSGYSDMAIGLGKMFGFTYKENFDYPYISKSTTEFWRRWHISLGTFFRDYVYIPLGGNRRLAFLNLFIVWFLTGMWHGASWNFILWGLYYFVLISLEKLILHKVFSRIPELFSRVYLSVAVLVGWVFFYHTDLLQALKFLGVMFGVKAISLSNEHVSAIFGYNAVYVIIALIACTPAVKIAYHKISTLVKAKMKVSYIFEDIVKPVIEVGILVLSIILLVGQSYNPFLYFRF